MPYKDPEKQKEATRLRQERKREEWRKLKEATPCADCGNFFPYYVMQLDHLKDKSFGLGTRSASFGSKYFKEELLKCDFVCANCHAIRTWQRNIVRG